MDSHSLLTDLFDTLNKRGVMSGLYIASVIITLVMSDPDVHLATDPNAWVLFVGVLIIGMIIASVTFEVFLPLFQLFTSPLTLRYFQAMVGGKIREQIPNYNALRKFREGFLASDSPEHLKERIVRDEDIRRLLTYLTTGSIANYALIAGAMILAPHIPPQVIQLLLVFTSYVFVGSIIGEIVRSNTYGLSLAMAYMLKDRSPASK